jgi:hypothetical protein
MAGAFSVVIDSPAGGGPSVSGRRVVPLPPPEFSGGVKFNLVVLSLAYDDLGQGPATVDVNVRILRGGGGVQVVNTSIPVGRTPVATAHVNDQAASVVTNAGGKINHLPAVTALVEYTNE